MGRKDNPQDLHLSQCMTIERLNNFDIREHVCVPGTTLRGHVVVRNPETLSVGEIRVALYGVSDAHIHRKISGIRSDYHGREFLFQEIKTLTNIPTDLEPSPDKGHRLPFEFIIPQMTAPVTERDGVLLNKWPRKPTFTGASDMHRLPPSCRFYKKTLLGHMDSSISYHLEATCSKIKGGSSGLPHAATTINFSPFRPEQNPDPRLQAVTSQLFVDSRTAPKMTLHIPSVCYTGGPFPLGLSCNIGGVGTPVTLIALDVRVEAMCWTRGRSQAFGEKESSEKQVVTIAAAQDLSIPVTAAATTLKASGLQLFIPPAVTPCFRSFTMSVMPYRLLISYTVEINGEVIRSKVTDRFLDVLPSMVQRTVVS